MSAQKKKTTLSWLWIASLSLTPVVLWYLAAPFAIRMISFNQMLLSASQVAALIGTALYSVTLILSARLKIFEKIFCGLNQVYERHSQLGQLALILLLFHPLLLLPSYVTSFKDALVFLIPGGSWALNWGIFSLGLMIFLIVITLYLRPRYNLWKWTHKFLGLAFFMGALHVWMIPSDTSNYMPLRLYILLLAAVGLLAFFYRTVFGKYLVDKLSYEISEIKVLNSGVTEITLKALGQSLAYKAGQFIFIEFPNNALGKESHPFSLVSSPKEPLLRLGIKNLGDYTSQLSALKVGDKALIEGPFGVFSFENASLKSQVWIAGGIGVTPFISMAQSLPAAEGYNVDLFYCVKNMSEVCYKETLDALAANPALGLRLHIFCSEEKGRLDAPALERELGTTLNGREYFMCAPPAMIHALRAQLLTKDVLSHDIHSEEFNF